MTWCVRPGILWAARLFQQMLIRHHDGIRAEYHSVRVPCEYSAGFIASQPLRVHQRRFIRERLFRNVRRFGDERNPGVA